MPPTALESLRALLLDPRSDPLDVGLALHALTPDDPAALGHGSPTELLEGPVVGGH